MPRVAPALWLSHNHSHIRLMSCGVASRSLRMIFRGSSSGAVNSTTSLPHPWSPGLLIVRQICRSSISIPSDVVGPSQPVIRVNSLMPAVMTKRKNHRTQAYGNEAFWDKPFGSEGYWDTSYSNNAKSFDWYQGYSGFSPLITKYLPKTSKILMVGCGNALLSEEMVKDGYQDIMNVDISAVVIEAMQKKYKDVPQLNYMRLDVREMQTFKDATFDAVVDKGMFDTLMCTDSGPYHTLLMLEEIGRVLKPGGVYMLITFGEPRNRMFHLRRTDTTWNIALHVLPRPGTKRAASSRVITKPVFLDEDDNLGPQFPAGDPDFHYVYVCTKGDPEEESSN